MADVNPVEEFYGEFCYHYGAGITAIDLVVPEPTANQTVAEYIFDLLIAPVWAAEAAAASVASAPANQGHTASQQQGSNQSQQQSSHQQ